MALPGVRKTFAIENCRDVIDKLVWEVEGLREQSHYDVRNLSFRAFNTAVTAWHVADWIWEDMTAYQRAAIPAKTKFEFQDHARATCRSVHLCQQVATASKHRVLFAKVDDPAVEVRVSAAPTDMTSLEPEQLSFERTRWSLKISDGVQDLDALHVFELALHYWTEFIYSRGIAAD